MGSSPEWVVGTGESRCGVQRAERGVGVWSQVASGGFWSWVMKSGAGTVWLLAYAPPPKLLSLEPSRILRLGELGRLQDLTDMWRYSEKDRAVC